jgi:hypothetical protein
VNSVISFLITRAGPVRIHTGFTLYLFFQEARKAMRLIRPKILFLAGLCMVVTGAGMYWREPEPAFALSVRNPDVDVGTVGLNQELPFSFTVRNSSREPLRIIGVHNEPC